MDTHDLDDLDLHLWRMGDPAPSPDDLAEILRIGPSWFVVCKSTAYGPFRTFRDALLAIGRHGLGYLPCSRDDCDARAELAVDTPFGLVTLCRAHFDPDVWLEADVVAIADLDALPLAEPNPAAVYSPAIPDDPPIATDPADLLRMSYIAVPAPDGEPREGWAAEVLDGERRGRRYGLYRTRADLVTDAIRRGLGTLMCPRCCGERATALVFPDAEADPELVCRRCRGDFAGPGAITVDLKTLEAKA